MPAPTKIDGTSENGGIGREKSDNLPEGVTISDLDLDHYTTAVELENLKDAVIDHEARVEGLETGTSSAFLERTIGRDDFTESPAGTWALDTANGGEVSWGNNGAVAGMGGAGLLALGVTTSAGSEASAFRAGTGLVRDTSKPIVVEWRLTVATAGAVSEDECEWNVGVSGDDGDSQVALFAEWDGTRDFSIVIVTAGVPAATPVTMPALGAGESYRIRLTILPGSVVLEAAIDEDDLVEIETVTAAVPASVYVPAARCSRETGAGDRLLLIDYVTWSGYRDVSAAAAGAGFLSGAVTEPVTDHGALTGLSDDDHTQYLLASGARNLTGNLAVTAAVTIDGRDLSVDGTKLDGIEALADVTDTTNVLAALAAAGASIDVNAQKITDLAIGTANTDAAHVGQVQQPAGRTVSGTTDTIVAGDIGNVVLYSQAGGVEVELGDLSGSLISGRALILTLQATNAATIITVDPGAGVTIDGSTSNYVAATGKARVSLVSLDGLAFYSGTP